MSVTTSLHRVTSTKSEGLTFCSFKLSSMTSYGAVGVKVKVFTVNGEFMQGGWRYSASHSFRQ